MAAKKYFFAFLLTLFSGTLFAQEMKLVYAVDVIRHGARAPMKLMPNKHAQHHWQAGPGQLLPIGLHQEFQLGKRARIHYIDNRFLPTRYNPSLIDKVVLYSTDVSRTLQSAQAFLQGFYPLGTGPAQYENSKTPPLPQAMAILPIIGSVGA